MVLENVFGQIGLAVLLLIIGFFIKKGISSTEEILKAEISQVKKEQQKMNGAVKEIVEKHNMCREELPVRFVDIRRFLERKEEVDNLVAELFAKLNPMAIDIAVIKREVEKG